MASRMSSEALRPVVSARFCKRRYCGSPINTLTRIMSPVIRALMYACQAPNDYLAAPNSRTSRVDGVEEIRLTRGVEGIDYFWGGWLRRFWRFCSAIVLAAARSSSPSFLAAARASGDGFRYGAGGDGAVGDVGEGLSDN